MLICYIEFILVKHSRPLDLKSSSNVNLPFAWTTGPATDPSFDTVHILDENDNTNNCTSTIHLKLFVNANTEGCSYSL